LADDAFIRGTPFEGNLYSPSAATLLPGHHADDLPLREDQAAAAGDYNDVQEYIKYGLFNTANILK